MEPSVVIVFHFFVYNAFISYRHRLLLFELNSTGHEIRIFKYDSLKILHTVQIRSRSTELTFKSICRLRKSSLPKFLCGFLKFADSFILV